MAENLIGSLELKAIGSIRGAEYIYPDRMQQISAITGVMHSVAELWGYSRIEGPTLQPVEFYAVKSSDELLADGYYVNTPGRTYMLRPEMTPTIAYMLANAEKSLTYPVRWYSDPQIYRNERPQSGRRRQFGQFNLDRFDLAPMNGDARAFADAEVISEAVETLSIMGLSSDDILVRVNSRSLLERAFDAIEIGSSEVRAKLLSIIDAKEKVPAEVFEARITNAGLSGQQVRKLVEWLSLTDLQQVAKSSSFALLVDSDEYRELQSLLGLLHSHGHGAYVKYDPIIVRGLGYYTGTVFEVFDRKPSLSMGRSILGGGRYDDFTQKFGGRLSITGVGFGIGHSPLELVLESRALFPKERVAGPDYYIAVQDFDGETSTDLGTVLRVAKNIRSAGKSVVIDGSLGSYGPSRLKKQLAAANRIAASKVLIFRGNNQDPLVKDLSTGEQSEISIVRIADTLLG